MCSFSAFADGPYDEDCPLCISPVTNTFSTLVWYFPGAVFTLVRSFNSTPKASAMYFWVPKNHCGDQHDLCIQDLLASRDLLHLHASGSRILFPGQLHDLHSFKFAVLILDKFLDCRLIYPRIMSVDRNGFFLAVIGLADLRPFGPGIILLFCPVPWASSRSGSQIFAP